MLGHTALCRQGRGPKDRACWTTRATIPTSHSKSITYSFKQLFHQSVHFFFCKKSHTVCYWHKLVSFFNTGEFQGDNARRLRQSVCRHPHACLSFARRTRSPNSARPGPRAWGTWWHRTAGPPEAASRREMRIRRQRDELTAPRVRRLLNGVEREVSSLSWDPVIAPKLLSNPVNDPEGLGNTPVKPVNAWKLEESPDQLTTDSKPHFLKLFRWLTTETNLKSYI